MLPLMRRNVTQGWDSPMDLFDREMSRWLRRAWGDAEDGSLIGVYPVDMREDDDKVYVEAELPGFTNKDVQVTLENGILHIIAERKTQETKGQTHLRERRFTRVARSFTLPTSVDSNKVEAKLENGVLQLTLHKTQEVKPCRIEVK